MYRMTTPRRVIVADHEAYMWDVVVDGVPHELAWWVSDGTLRMSFTTNGTRRSTFVRLGPRFSPRHSLSEADASVRAWMKSHRHRVAS